MFLQANIEDFKYYVRQRIGIYYKDADWMEMAFQTVLKCYDECLIQEVRNSHYNKIIKFKNGDMIKFVLAVGELAAIDLIKFFYNRVLIKRYIKRLLNPVYLIEAMLLLWMEMIFI